MDLVCSWEGLPRPEIPAIIYSFTDHLTTASLGTCSQKQACHLSNIDSIVQIQVINRVKLEVYIWHESVICYFFLTFMLETNHICTWSSNHTYSYRLLPRTGQSHGKGFGKYKDHSDISSETFTISGRSGFFVDSFESCLGDWKLLQGKTCQFYLLFKIPLVEWLACAILSTNTCWMNEEKNSQRHKMESRRLIPEQAWICLSDILTWLFKG